MSRVFTTLVIMGLVLVLGVANYNIGQKQQVVENGQQVLLKLRPVDPRSLMQGDYMRLRYAETVLPDSTWGMTPHRELCTPLRLKGDQFVTENTCSKAVDYQVMASGQPVVKRRLAPGEVFETGLAPSSMPAFTTCPVGFETTVALTQRNRNTILSSQYYCTDSPDEPALRKGTIVMKLDSYDVGTFARKDDGSQIYANETRLQYKLILTNGEFRLGAESFFFQEGQAKVFENARYGVLRVAEDGASVLVGLADEARRLITPPESE